MNFKCQQSLANGDYIYPIAYVKPEEIVYVQKAALNNTLTVHLADMRQLDGVRLTLKQFKDSLGRHTYVCPHLSFLVNPDYVLGLKPRQPGDELYFIELKDRSERIPVSKSKLSKVRSVLEFH